MERVEVFEATYEVYPTFTPSWFAYWNQLVRHFPEALAHFHYRYLMEHLPPDVEPPVLMAGRRYQGNSDKVWAIVSGHDSGQNQGHDCVAWVRSDDNYHYAHSNIFEEDLTAENIVTKMSAQPRRFPADLVSRFDPNVPLFVNHAVRVKSADYVHFKTIDGAQTNFVKEGRALVFDDMRPYNSRGLYMVHIRDKMHWWINGELHPSGEDIPIPDYLKYPKSGRIVRRQREGERPLYKRGCLHSDIIENMITKGYTSVGDYEELRFV